MKILNNKKLFSLLLTALLSFELMAQTPHAFYIDTTYNFLGIGTSAGATNMVLQSDGSVILGGIFNDFNGDGKYNHLVKLDVNGYPDTAYANRVVNIDQHVTALCLQPDGKLLVGGYYTTINGAFAQRMVRLNTDGTRDYTFNLDTILYNPPSPLGGYFNTLTDIEIFNNDIYIAGSFSFYNAQGVPSFSGIGKLTSTGKIDTISFNAQTGVTTASINDMEIQADGKILVGGTFNTFNGVSVNRMLRLNADGSIDNSFTAGFTTSDDISKIKVLSTGKILVGGVITSYNGTPANGMVRLNTDGTIDNAFTMGTGFANTINPSATNVVEIKEAPDHKIIASGYFTSYNESIASGLVGLNADGTIDSTFIWNFAQSGGIEHFEYQDASHLIISGDVAHSYYNDATHNNVTATYAVLRLGIRAVSQTVTAVTPTASNISISVYPVPSSGKFEVHIPEGEQIKEISLTNALGQNEIVLNTATVETRMNGLLYLSIKTDKATYQGKVVVSE